MAGRPRKPERLFKRSHRNPSPAALDQRNEQLQAGLDAHRAGRFLDAQRHYRDLVSAHPTAHRALQLLGVVCHQLGDHSAAENYLRTAIELAGDVAEYQANLGGVLLNLSRNSEAIVCLERARDLCEPNADTLFNLGEAQRRNQQLDAAESTWLTALAIRPDSSEILNHLGMLEIMRHRWDLARQYFERALQIKPNCADSLNNLGIVTQSTGDVHTALSLYKQALRVRPRFAEACNQLAMAYRDLNQVDEALACYKQALEFKPDFHLARSAYVYLLNYDLSASKQQILDEHRKWADLCCQVTPLPPAPNDRSPDRTLRIGLLSPDLRRHPVAKYLEPILQLHDRGRFHLTCYAEVANPDDVTERLRGHVSEWRFTNGMDDRQVAELVRSDKIDILLDLAGHTANSRLRSLAFRPAPIQVSYLGYPATTGLNAVDYYLTDPILVPEGEEVFFSETVLRLPRVCCFTPPESAPPVAPPPYVRNGQLTFGSLHRPEKLTASTFDLWSSVLRRVPEARLLVFWAAMRPEVQERIRSQLIQRGVLPRQLEVRSELRDSNYLSVYNEIDIGLDVVPWNGGTTTLEALWMGVTVLGLMGDRMLSRGTASILTHIGHPQLVAHCSQAYVDLASDFAADPGRLISLRSRLRKDVHLTMADGLTFIQNLEATYRSLWHHWCSRHPAV